MPIATTLAEPQRVYRKIAYGPLLDVFMLDMRTYRGPNGDNLEPVEGGTAAFLGAEQLAWLKRELRRVEGDLEGDRRRHAASLVVWDNWPTTRARASRPSPTTMPASRSAASSNSPTCCASSRRPSIRNTVWLTADVHYTAAHYYNPNKAAFQDFEPFWEFVSGPIHAGTFGPNDLDMTFGPELKFVKAPPAGPVNLSPAAGLQFFGHVKIAADTGVMTVTLTDTADTALWSIDLEPKRA